MLPPVSRIAAEVAARLPLRSTPSPWLHSAAEGSPEGEQEAKSRFFGFEEDLSNVDIPGELGVLPLRGVVIFPSAIVPLLISRGASLKAVESALSGDRMLALVAQKNPEEEAPDEAGLYVRGTAGRILKMLKYPDGSVRILVQGLRRMEIAEYLQLDPFFKARVRLLTDALQLLQSLHFSVVNG